MSLPVLAKSDRPSDPAIVTTPRHRTQSGDDAIRCPLCGWRPTSASRWCCDCLDTPEPFFHGCGTVWNTFATRGRCPGCHHQWQWTTCLSCMEPSLHDHWYQRAS